MQKKVKFIVLPILIVAIVASAVCLCFVFKYQLKYAFCKREIELNKTINNVSVMTYNVRSYQREDKRERSWYYRSQLVEEILQEYQPSIICFQEVQAKQLKHLKKFLKGYDSVVAYSDQESRKEGLSIFYRTDLYTLNETQTFWLSDTPDEMSNSWGLSHNRICVMATFTTIKTGSTFLVANTHLDTDTSTHAKSLRLITDKIESKTSYALLMGDFNAKLDSDTLAEANNRFIDVGANFDDENAPTYNHFSTKWDKDFKKVDYILRYRSRFAVESYKVIDKAFDGKLASDHFPVYAEVVV